MFVTQWPSKRDFVGPASPSYGDSRHLLARVDRCRPRHAQPTTHEPHNSDLCNQPLSPWRRTCRIRLRTIRRRLWSSELDSVGSGRWRSTAPSSAISIA